MEKKEEKRVEQMDYGSTQNIIPIQSNYLSYLTVCRANDSTALPGGVTIIIMRGYRVYYTLFSLSRSFFLFFIWSLFLAFSHLPRVRSSYKCRCPNTNIFVHIYPGHWHVLVCNIGCLAADEGFAWRLYAVSAVSSFSWPARPHLYEVHSPCQTVEGFKTTF